MHIYEADSPFGYIGWDPTFKEANVAIATAVLMNTSLVVTCIPFLKPLMEALQPGWSTSDLVKGVGYNVTYGKSALSSGKFATGSVIGGRHKVESLAIMRTENFQLESRSDESL